MPPVELRQEEYLTLMPEIRAIPFFPNSLGSIWIPGRWSYI